jgi:SAM-dependent methyltransferase
MTEHHGALQESEYSFPYHYLAHFSNGGVPSTRRSLFWGWEYLTYMDHVVSEIEAMTPASVLDVGCGDGYMVNQLCARGFPGRLRGVDTSARAITFARAFCPRDDVFSADDIFTMQAQSELVTMIEVIEHIPDDAVGGFLRQAFALSSRHVLISVPTTAFELQKKHYRHYDEALLARQTGEAATEFELVKSVRLYDERPYLRLMKRVLENRLVSLTNRTLLRLIWSYHRRATYFAQAPSGFHLVALYRRRGS